MMMPICTGSISVDSLVPLAPCSPISVVRLRFAAWPDGGGIFNAVRSHWSIENGLHWVLDLAFEEDRSRMRKDHSQQNFVVLRHMALNLLKQEHTATCGIKARRLKAGWSEDYLRNVLAA